MRKKFMDKSPVLFYKKDTCALGSLISLLWLNQPFRLCRLETKADNENPDFLKLNGLGEVPTLFLADGTVLTENVAVLQHIGEMDLQKKLTYPPKTPAFDQLNRALGFLSSTFHKSFLPVFHTDLLYDDQGVQKEIKKKFTDGHLREVWEYANEHLVRTTFLFDHPMIADAYFFSIARWGEDLFDIKKDFPHIHRFQKAMAENEAVKFALEIEAGKHTAGKGNFLGHVDFATFVIEAAERKEARDQKHGDGEFTPGLHTEKERDGKQSSAANR
jgi:glutathione S-transferase